MNYFIVKRIRNRAGRRGFKVLQIVAWFALILRFQSSVQAQIIYLSDDRSITVSGGISVPNYGPGIFESYSGGYSSSTSPAAPFMELNTDVTGSASLFVSNGVEQSTYTTRAEAQQTSILNSSGIYYASDPVGPSPILGGPSDSGCASSFLTVSFMVPAQLTYNLTAWNALGFNQDFSFTALGPDPWSSAQPNLDGSSTWSGQLDPGVVYTLSLKTFTDEEWPNMELITPGISGMQVDLTVVPEPEPIWLLVLGLAGLVAFNSKRSQKQKLTCNKQ